MAMGKPVAAFVGSAKGLRHMEHAFIVPDHDWQGLGQGISLLLQDPALAAKLGNTAQQWVREHLSWPHLIPKIEQTYYQLRKT
jgi:glycosyltransferase involved in cell wall biosynthesis